MSPLSRTWSMLLTRSNQLLAKVITVELIYTEGLSFRAGRGAVAESVERGPRVQEIGSLVPGRVEPMIYTKLILVAS